jgi:Glyoxalase-like domain
VKHILALTTFLLGLEPMVGRVAREPLARAAPLKVDHASVCGSELEPLQQAFAEVGLKADYGGRHANGATQMALLGFEDGSYLELIAPQKPGVFEGSDWAKFMAANAGTCAWAVTVDDIGAEIARLKRSGIEGEGPFPGSRRRPDGTVLQWETARVGSGTPGATLPFLIQDKTPRSLRVQPSASVKGAGLAGIAIVVLGVRHLDEAIALFRRTYGWPAPALEENREFGAELAHFLATPVVLAAPLDQSSWLAERLERLGESPAALLLNTQRFDSAVAEFKLSNETIWFGQKVAWFNREQLRGVRLGVIRQ